MTLEMIENNVLGSVDGNNIMGTQERLDKSSARDGNIAFKVTYNDSDWSGTCSLENYQENIGAKRVWCTIQADSGINCQSEIYKDATLLTAQNFPCHDSIAKKELMFYAGAFSRR